MIAPDTDPPASRIARVHCTDDFLVVTLSCGRTLSAPLDWFPTLRDSNIVARTNAAIVRDGAGIYWSALMLDISLATLLSGKRQSRVA